jgi:DNA-directed RNA polymerase III subunit RPC3
MDIVESRHGVHARDVVQNLLLLGHTKVSDLEEAYESKQKHYSYGNGNGYVMANGTNSQSRSHVSSASQLHTILAQLLQAGLVEPVVKSMFRSPTDTYKKIEREILHESFGGSTKGVKQKEELKVKIRDRLQALRTEGREWKPHGKKRLLNGEHVNGGAVNGDHFYEDDGTRLDVGFPSFTKAGKELLLTFHKAKSGCSYQLRKMYSCPSQPTARCACK